MYMYNSISEYTCVVYIMYDWYFKATRTCTYARTRVQMMFHLPYRAVGHDWYLIYSTFKHGISLKTLYRNMMMFENEDSPILLVVRDEQKKVLPYYGCLEVGGESILVHCYPLNFDHLRQHLFGRNVHNGVYSIAASRNISVLE